MQFIDISSYNTVSWTAYSAWSSMVAIKSSEGVGFIDSAFSSHRAGALAVGINSVWYYHFAKPDLGNDPIAEANWQHYVVGAIRPQDRIVLDFEVSNPRATADWAYRFLAQQEANYDGQLPVIYASTSYILARMQDNRLEKYPLWLADWTHDPAARPLCPSPWTSYAAIQYTDQATGIPGIAETVDADIFLGGVTTIMTIPDKWSYNANTKVLTAPNGHTVHQGFAQFVLLSPAWDAGNVPLEDEHGVQGGTAQLFRDGELAWNAKDGVHYAPIGLLYQAAEAQITALQAQVTVLQKQIATVPANVTHLANQISAVLLELQKYNTLIAADIAATQAVLQAITP